MTTVLIIIEMFKKKCAVNYVELNIKTNICCVRVVTLILIDIIYKIIIMIINLLYHSVVQPISE